MFSVLILFGTLGVSVAMPQCLTPFGFVPEANCRGYYYCVFGHPIKMPDCPAKTVFSRRFKVCVRAFGLFDDCTPTLEHLPIQEQCELLGTDLIPHPTECQAYYNCSHTYQHVPRLFEQHLLECPYSQLYDPYRESCQPFKGVHCGKRQEFKNACDYRRNQCPAAHCIPCYVIHPNCVGKPDGINVDDNRLWSPFFAICDTERSVSREACRKDELGRTQIFHPERKMCVELEYVPREHGGLMSNCTGRPDGNYLDDLGRCNRYTVCRGEEFVTSVRCGEGELFDERSRRCQPSAQVCGQCGNPNC